MSTGYYVVQIGAHLVRAYSDDELDSLYAVRALLDGEQVNCRKALKGLYILMQRHVSPSLVNEVDKRLAEVIRSEQCGDL